MARLSQDNLETHTKLTTLGRSSDMSKKRRKSVSVESFITDASSQSKQGSSISLTDYRLKTLQDVGLVAVHTPLPTEIDVRVRKITAPEISEERKKELHFVSDKTYKLYPDILAVASRGDDIIEPIFQALQLLYGETFVFRRKADWKEELIPNIESQTSDPDGLNEPSRRPSKRKQQEASDILPESQKPATFSPSQLLKESAFSVKVPCPSLTTGFRNAIVTKKLRELGMDQFDATKLLRYLESGTCGQALHSSPTKAALSVSFPMLVIEGKSYGTGRTLYEAQNQALVSTGSMVNLRRQLNDRADRASPGSHTSDCPLAFAICTEGDTLQLWVDYPTSIQDARFYNMSYVATCNVADQEGLREFFLKIEGVMRWAMSELDDIAKRLVSIWEAETQKAR